MHSILVCITTENVTQNGKLKFMRTSRNCEKNLFQVWICNLCSDSGDGKQMARIQFISGNSKLNTYSISVLTENLVLSIV